MESKQTGRVILILLVLVAALFAICPQPWRLGRAPLSEVLNLKPGIDMVGGTSLLYQIEMPDGGWRGEGTLAEAEVAALKRRIDPNGVKNYIWRPQGNDRIEIQIPASAKNEQAIAARDKYIQAQRDLDATNINAGDVMSAIQNLTGDAREKKLAELAAGLPARTELFKKMAADADTIKRAHQQMLEDSTEATASVDLEKLKAQVDSTNLPSQKLEASLAADPKVREADLAADNAAAAGYPARQAAIANFVKASDYYRSFKGGVDDAAQLKRDLQGAGLLEFHIEAVGTDAPSAKEYQRMVQQLAAKGPKEQAGDKFAWFEDGRPPQKDRAGNVIVNPPGEMFNGKHYVLCLIDEAHSMVNGPGKPQWSMQHVGRQQSGTGGDVLAFRFDSIGGSVFYKFTSANIGKGLAAILDKKIVSIANINSAIGADGEISGDYSDEELNYMVTTLAGGSLPARLREEPISENTVGPQLGQENLKRGLMACGFGLVIVAAFLIIYYYRAGMVATAAVLMNVILILGVLAGFNATFTLPGIAGIVLTIGAAVDANVLIFERLREEQHKDLGLRVAMKNAYDHARTAIWDSNATTIITSLILVWLGSEEVKGFGLTLLVGLISSLFTSLFVTRTIFNIMIDTFNVKKLGSFPLTFPRWDKLLKPDINWMKYVPYFVAFSAVFIIAGASAFVAKARSNELADVDFTSGTQVEFDLKQPMKRDAVEALFKDSQATIPSPYVTAVGNVTADGSTTYDLVTANADAKAVRGAVMTVMGSRITSDLPSKFDNVTAKVDEAIKDQTVVPIVHLPFKLKDVTIPAAENYLGGVAVTLNNITPPLKPDQIRDRLDRQRATEEAAGGTGVVLPPHDIYVYSPSGPGLPTSTAVIFSADQAYPYSTDPAKWTSNVADPVWRLVTSGINKEGTLQKVNTFGPQVAGDNQLSAMLALILSSLVIMAFIWFRFGNLKYGMATVLAMIHDVALVVGAIGLSHWVSQYTPWLAHALLIEPFRVNLTIVAAVLTVMSYSMIDTIVVFDRIRENRGKFGHLSKAIVNDSINQTLSRTLLTAGTTLATIAGMYIVGGPGIHGFTFVLLVGILVGTYSSIAIAAPILLFGADAKVKSGQEPPVGALQRVPA
jgi:SecD/SecF fusion protein